jgi:hypothetical protein
LFVQSFFSQLIVLFSCIFQFGKLRIRKKVIYGIAALPSCPERTKIGNENRRKKFSFITKTVILSEAIKI